jgi:hypothetical protein
VKWISVFPVITYFQLLGSRNAFFSIHSAFWINSTGVYNIPSLLRAGEILVCKKTNKITTTAPRHVFQQEETVYVIRRLSIYQKRTEENNRTG